MTNANAQVKVTSSRALMKKGLDLVHLFMPRACGTADLLVTSPVPLVSIEKVPSMKRLVEKVPHEYVESDPRRPPWMDPITRCAPSGASGGMAAVPIGGERDEAAHGG